MESNYRNQVSMVHFLMNYTTSYIYIYIYSWQLHSNWVQDVCNEVSLRDTRKNKKNRKSKEHKKAFLSTSQVFNGYRDEYLL